MDGSRTARLPLGLADEIAWDLLRDEWELLMAVGTGPTELLCNNATSRLPVPAGGLQDLARRAAHEPVLFLSPRHHYIWTKSLKNLKIFGFLGGSFKD